MNQHKFVLLFLQNPIGIFEHHNMKNRYKTMNTKRLNENNLWKKDRCSLSGDCSWVGHHSAALVGPSSKGIVLVGPSASAKLNGPDGSHISAQVPKLIAEPRHGGSVAGSIVPGHRGGWGGWDGGNHGAVILGGRRNGKAPRKEMHDVINKAVQDAKDTISKNLVLQEKCLSMAIIKETIDLLRGSVTIVYPMKLPPHDVIRMEFENIEDLAGTQASRDVIDPSTAQLWFCGKELYRDGKLVGDFIGKIENCKILLKLSKRGSGPPGREPVMSEEDRKQLMLKAYRKQEEWKKLSENDDDNYLNSDWADGSNLKRAFHGLNNISWRPGK